MIKNEFKYLNKYTLDYLFWEEAPNYFVLNFIKMNKDKDKHETKIYVSTDGGRLFSRWKPAHRGKLIHPDELIATKNVLFGKSSLKRTFFYVDSQLNIFSVHTYENKGDVIPSSFDPSYLFKFTEDNVTKT
ncbi:hypothetical protein RF11_14746 [Thelohanellus kitauei]|uniref:Sortilin N-terminal domain-containing protein n=1 Tax=Thelohanellus kitauei TaxID=669202 RepID=A0A0C2ILB5_THEKT|nr:hypothetical protein RF11_14746 [Thelohanellus kitauei]